jgi:uncharacterized membrane protein
VADLYTTIAVYPDEVSAERDWGRVEAAAGSDVISLADAALVRRWSDDGRIETLERASHHGWGKGAVAGAVVGILVPASRLGGAVVGGLAGGVVARLNRSLDRGDIKDLGEVMDSGEIALVVITNAESTDALKELLTGAKSMITKASATAEEVRAELDLLSGQSTT